MKDYPAIGSIRQKTKFAWIPKKVSLRSIWLRKYVIYEYLNENRKWIKYRERLM